MRLKEAQAGQRAVFFVDAAHIVLVPLLKKLLAAMPMPVLNIGK
jgi:hypothetical protein